MGRRTLQSALDASSTILERLCGRTPALFLDYDGTLTPIAARPEQAVLSDNIRRLLRRLASRCPVAIISGRDLKDVRSLVQLDDLYYAGSHGFEIAGPGGTYLALPEAQAALPDLDQAECDLADALKHYSGAWLERKRFAIAVHFRQVPDDDVPAMTGVVEKIAAHRPRLRLRGGKKIHELQPDVEWHKGKAVLWLMERMFARSNQIAPIYIGDDVTDEDAFTAIGASGVTIRVGMSIEPTAARFSLDDPTHVGQFLAYLLSALPKDEAAR